MAPKQIFLTAEGRARLEHELEYLRTVRRQEVAEKIQRAKETGGIDHNAEYDTAKDERAIVEGRIQELEQTLSNAILIQAETSAHDQVRLGCQVTVRNQDGKDEHYTIVGTAEANPNDGKISHQSPVGQALLGKKVGDMVEVVVPAGVIKLRITKIF